MRLMRKNIADHCKQIAFGNILRKNMPHAFCVDIFNNDCVYRSCQFKRSYSIPKMIGETAYLIL